jgi:hypothetical protein
VTVLGGSVGATTPELLPAFVTVVNLGVHSEATSSLPRCRRSSSCERPPSLTPRTSTSAALSRSTSPSLSTADHHSVVLEQVVHRVSPSATSPAPPMLQSLDCKMETLPSSATRVGPAAGYACTTTHPGPAAQERHVMTSSSATQMARAPSALTASLAMKTETQYKCAAAKRT